MPRLVCFPSQEVCFSSRKGTFLHAYGIGSGVIRRAPRRVSRHYRVLSLTIPPRHSCRAGLPFTFLKWKDLAVVREAGDNHQSRT